MNIGTDKIKGTQPTSDATLDILTREVCYQGAAARILRTDTGAHTDRNAVEGSREAMRRKGPEPGDYSGVSSHAVLSVSARLLPEPHILGRAKNTQTARAAPSGYLRKRPPTVPVAPEVRGR